MLGKLAGQDEPDSRLDLAGRDRGLLVVTSKARCLGSNLLEDVVNERVHNRHSLGADSGVGVDLLEHLVDVDLVGLSLGFLLLLAIDILLCHLLYGVLVAFGSHFDGVRVRK